MNTYLYLGEYDKFLDSLPEVDDSAFILFYRGFGEYHRKNWDQAAKDFDRAFHLDSSILYAQIGKALGDSIMHREANGLEILHALEKKVAERGVGDPEATYKMAQAYSILGDRGSAASGFAQQRRRGILFLSLPATDPLLDAVRKEPEFAEILNRARGRYEAFRVKFF